MFSKNSNITITRKIYGKWKKESFWSCEEKNGGIILSSKCGVGNSNLGFIREQKRLLSTFSEIRIRSIINIIIDKKNVTLLFFLIFTFITDTLKKIKRIRYNII